MRNQAIKLAIVSVLIVQTMDIAGCSKAAPTTASSPPAEAMPQGTELADAQIGTIQNLHIFGNVYLAGQPGQADFQRLKERGVASVINLRMPGEFTAFEESKIVTDLHMEYHAIPFGQPETLTDQVFADVRQKLREANTGGVLLHCASANRVGAIWLVKRVIDDQHPFDLALEEAKRVGLRSAGLLDRAKQYIDEHSQP